MKILIGDILKSEAQTLVNTVNCVGVMGKGIALEFKNQFPDMFKDYALRCERNEIKPGQPHLYRTMFPPQIINFPTKDHWKSVSKIDNIERGLELLVDKYTEWGVKSLALPPLGCGNGQLEWRVVGPLIYQYAKQMGIPVEMYAPYGTKPQELTPEFLEKGGTANVRRSGENGRAALAPSWVALVEIVNRIEQQPYHRAIGRTIFQKIAYVATSEGLPTNLDYQRGSFGPFSKDLKSVEAKLINNGLLQEKREGNMFRVMTGPNYGRIYRKYASEFERWENVIGKTADLFMRLSTDQAEIIATVLFVAKELKRKQDARPSEKEILDTVMQWKQKRQPPLDALTVASTIRNLGILRWLDVQASPDLPMPEDEPVII